MLVCVCMCSHTWSFSVCGSWLDTRMFVCGISIIKAYLRRATFHAVVSVWLAYDKCVLVVKATFHTVSQNIHAHREYFLGCLNWFKG